MCPTVAGIKSPPFTIRSNAVPAPDQAYAAGRGSLAVQDQPIEFDLSDGHQADEVVVVLVHVGYYAGYNLLEYHGIRVSGFRTAVQVLFIVPVLRQLQLQCTCARRAIAV